MSVVVQEEKLVFPLHDDAQGVFQESNNDEESANGGQVAVQEQRRTSQQLPMRLTRGELAERGSNGTCGHLRLDRLAQIIEHILDLAGVRSDLVEQVSAGLLCGRGTAVLRRAIEPIS